MPGEVATAETGDLGGTEGEYPRIRREIFNDPGTEFVCSPYHFFIVGTVNLIQIYIYGLKQFFS